MKKWRILTLATLLMTFTLPVVAIPRQAPLAQTTPATRARRHRRRHRRRKAAARRLNHQRRVT
jgi:hypothetical protein